MNKNIQELEQPVGSDGNEVSKSASSATLIIGVFTAIYVPFTVIQALSFNHFFAPEIARLAVGQKSVGVNILLSIWSGLFFLFGRFSRNRPEFEEKFFMPVFGIYLTGLYIAWLIHIHFAGTQSSQLPLLLLATSVALIWMIPYRWTVIVFVTPMVGYLGVVLLEIVGILPYAPLLNDSEQLKEIYLNWKVVVTNMGIYFFSVTIIMSILYFVRRELAQKQRTLETEIEVRKETETEKEVLIKDLRQALADVQELKGLLPICAHCKKVRDDTGYWEQIEGYLQTRSDLTFTHGICPDCRKKFYSKYENGDDEEK